MGSKL